MTTLSKLAQIALSTRDLPKAVAFYRDVLGLKLMFEVSGMAFFDMAGTRLMIGAAHFTGPLAEQHLSLLRRRRLARNRSRIGRTRPQIRPRRRNRATRRRQRTRAPLLQRPRRQRPRHHGLAPGEIAHDFVFSSTNSSDADGCSATVASKSRFVAFIFTAIATHWIISAAASPIT